MVDDSYYITPHETALAVVATAMKKGRLRLDTLILNSIMGGVFFSAGSMLYLCWNSENPEIFASNPGMLNSLGALTFSIGLFYVVITGADLFNSNILFFSVGLLRGAVSIYDLLISWMISWFGNLGGVLFVCYVICYLSGSTTSELYISGSIYVSEFKASFSFIQSFIKGIAGNFFVCLAVYLQLMCKPLHVKLIMMTLPIFTFVSMGFAHIVADMYLVTMGMLNGANITVGTFIYKILVPVTLGNMVGGAAFGLIIPYYLHLVVVERDRKELSLPEFEARDEQPELNMDSRVVRVNPSEIQSEEGDSDEELEERDNVSEKQSLSSGSDDTDNTNNENDNRVLPYNPNPSGERINRVTSEATVRSMRRNNVRSPPGVFPVRGMGKPLTRERTIVDAEYSPKNAASASHTLSRTATATTSLDMLSVNSDEDSNIEQPVNEALPSLLKTLSRVPTKLSSRPDHNVQEQEREEEEKYEREGHYNVREHKIGTKLEKALTRITTHKSDTSLKDLLPRTTQDIFPEQRVQSETDPLDTKNSVGGLFRTLSKPFVPTKKASGIGEIHRRLSQAGITSTAASAADNIAGIDNYEGIDLPRSHSPFYARPSGTISSVDSTGNNDAPLSFTRNSQLNNLGGGFSVAGKRSSQNRIKTTEPLPHFDNDDFEEQSVIEL